MPVLSGFLTLLAAVIIGFLVWTGIGQWWVERKFPPVGQFITVDGLRLHYVIAGKGPGIILVHGASSNLQEFTSSILPELAKTHRVIAFDRPGYGYSQAPSDDVWFDPAAVAGLFLQAAAELGVEKPVILGHSWGGSVVMAALVYFPERISGGVLLSGVAGHWAGPLNWTYGIGDKSFIGPLFAWTMVYPLGSMVLANNVQEVFTPDIMPEGHLDRAAVALALRPATFQRNVRDMNKLNEYMQVLSPHYDQVKTPLLIIHGEDDILVPFWNHGRRLVPVIKQAEVVLLPDTGHAPHHTQTAKVCAAIEQFYAEISAPQQAATKPRPQADWPIMPPLPDQAPRHY
jgi:pimeloyl-ACP methyl ester carboxylesterase